MQPHFADTRLRVVGFALRLAINALYSEAFTRPNRFALLRALSIAGVGLYDFSGPAFLGIGVPVSLEYSPQLTRPSDFRVSFSCFLS